MIRSLDDLKKETKDNKKTTNSYAGGASSGINVENPDNDSKNPGKSSEEDFQKESNRIKLTVYKNGFQIDDGPFRDISDPVNKKFMTEVEKGYIPQELVDKGYKSLGIAMDDKKTEEYKEPIPEKKFQAFVGQGQNMGGSSSQGLEINKNVEFYIDKAAPTTRINIRLHNGETITQEFNLSHTVDDIFGFVTQTAPVDGSFQLIEGFPPKPLTDFDKSIEQLKLQGTTLTQRLS